MELFLQNGYGDTTIPMIAEASGVSRTSVFRYWKSKSEIVWAEFDRHTERLEELLEEVPENTSTMQAVRECVVLNLETSMSSSAFWMERFVVLDSSPDLRPDGAARWLAWADTVASFVARRQSWPHEGVLPQSVGGAVQAAFLTVLRSWRDVDHPTSALLPRLDDALVPLCDVLQGWVDAEAAREML